jgi:ubiquinone biosynthesis protein COQ9
MTVSADLSNSISRHDPIQGLRDRYLDAALDEACFSGWLPNALARARLAAGLSEGEALLAAPRGAVDLIDAWFDRAERAMERAIGDCAPGTRIREKATLAVRVRLEALSPHKESLRRAAIYLAVPHNAPDGVRIGWRAADRAWVAMGDPSTDFNYYSKRTILSGVHLATLAYWLQDESEDSTATWAFLDKQIDGVMQFEKVKAQVTRLIDKLPDPLGVLTRLRYGAQPKP